MTSLTPDRIEDAMIENLDGLILSADGIDDPESDTFMRGFAYGRFTKMDSELARHWGVGRGRPVEEGENLLATIERLITAATNLADEMDGLLPYLAAHHCRTEPLEQAVSRVRALTPVSKGDEM